LCRPECLIRVYATRSGGRSCGPACEGQLPDYHDVDTGTNIDLRGVGGLDEL
jgi:hypothetical protein